MRFESRGGKGSVCKGCRGLSIGVFFFFFFFFLAFFFGKREALGGGGDKEKRCEVWRETEKVRHFACPRSDGKLSARQVASILLHSLRAIHNCFRAFLNVLAGLKAWSV